MKIDDPTDPQIISLARQFGQSPEEICHWLRRLGAGLDSETLRGEKLKEALDALPEVAERLERSRRFLPGYDPGTDRGPRRGQNETMAQLITRKIRGLRPRSIPHPERDTKIMMQFLTTGRVNLDAEGSPTDG